MTILKPDEARIAQLHLLSNDNAQISKMLGIDLDKVNDTLLLPQIQSFIKDVRIEDYTRDGKLLMVEGAKSLLPKIIEGAQKIADEVDAKQWNKNHVELFKLLISNLAKEEKNIVNNISNQINIQNNNVGPQSEMDGLDEMISGLPATTQGEFWEQVFLLAKSFQDEFSKGVVKTIG